MQIDILTLFPEMFQGPFEDSILKRARERGLVDIRVHNFREYGLGRHRQVDDAPYGGGAGMLLRPEPLFAAIEALLGRSLGDAEHRQPPGPGGPPVILLSPQGRRFSQAIAAELAGRGRLILVCGHYEGVDERVRRHAVSDEISIGDYVLTGGELAAMVVVDAVVRLIPGVLGGETSAEEESFVQGLLEYPHYTRPPDFRGWEIPDVLLSGHHAEIAKWRRRQAILRTLERRPDLLPAVELTRDEQRWLEELRREQRPIPTDLPRRVHGIDFSGAEQAGKKIWIASGTVDGERLRIEACRRADLLLGCNPDRGACLSSLRAFIAEQGACAIGLDFPFGLPKPFLDGAAWEQLVLSFADRYPTAEAFHEACRAMARSPEMKRATDVESKTPFSTYGVRIYKQTYYGIRDVLAPLVRDHLVSVLPMQRPVPGKPWLLEICPASTLKLEGVYKPPYKGSEAGQRGARHQILRQLEARGCTFASSEVADTATIDKEGDALDSIVAAFATFRALRNPATLTVGVDDLYAVEGYVYV